MKPETIRTKNLGLLPEFGRNHIVKYGRKSTLALLCLTLVAIIIAVYMQVGNHQFLYFDDNDYVTENPHVASGITGRNIIWAFTSVDAANWLPVTWLSHMADAQLYGMNPRGHHVTNVVIHTLSTLFAFLLLVRITGALWQSLFVAAMFALHPLHVESVAWVAERKDVLSTLFWFLSLLFYSEYVAKRKPTLYIFSLLAFVLGLMSKPMLVTLPIVMLLMDFWPLNRFRFEGQQPGLRRPDRMIDLIKEKIPFFACSLFSGFITIYAQHQGGAIAALSRVPFQLRIENALVAYVRYIGKTLWPHDLAVYYPLPSSIPLWQVIGSLVILLLLSSAAIQRRRRHPYLVLGWFWFLVTLLPVIGLIQVGGQSMADRYTYIPLAGLFIMAAWGIPDMTKGLLHRQYILALLAGAVIIAATALTWRQLGYWHDNISLYRHTLQVTAGSDVIHNNLGSALDYQGETSAAIQEYHEALRLNPNNPDAHNNLGTALQTKGDLDGAIRQYHEALLIKPNHTKAHNNLGVTLQAKGDLDAAILEYRETLRISPNDTDAQFYLRLALDRKSRQK